MQHYKSVCKALSESYGQWKTAAFQSRRISPELFHSLLKEITEGKNILESQELGTSFEGRPIRLVTVGTGATSVLLWSQMHGDESTATMAIADMLNYFRLHSDDEISRTILSRLTLLFLPMLNPDGAVRFQRRTAQGIDMNRDALALQTPEARLLTRVQQEKKPTFAFNLHDQELSTVGTSRELTALALLAPAFDEHNTDNDVRLLAKKLAATFAETMSMYIPGKIARYDETFEPRAFGDTMQSRGTSTLLVESGHLLNDPEKQAIRQLNAVGILTSLYAIATGEYSSTNVAVYDSLPFNGKRAYDVIIRNVRLQHKNGETTAADLGISYQVDTHTEETPMLVDIGDLRTFVGLREVDGRGKRISSELLSLGKPFLWGEFFA